MFAFFPKQRNDWLYILAFLAILTGFILSVASLLNMCVKECSNTHNWRLFGMPFEYTGILFFLPLLAFHLLSIQYRIFSFLAGLMLAAGLGAEVKFIEIQKYDIGSWCPLCLSIAACIFCAALCYSIVYFVQLYNDYKHGPKGKYMISLWKGISGIAALFAGFFAAFVGAAHFTPLEAAEKSVKENLFFGDNSSPIEVYVFTDWACPACRQLEPELIKMAPDLMKKGKLMFVDHAIHTETLNYSPYNVSFMIKDKPKYLQIRDDLVQLSIDTPEPTEDQIEKIAQKNGIKYQQLNFSDIAASQKYFKELAQQFGVKSTPTIIIVNTDTKKGKKLTGFNEINESNLMKAIKSLQS